MMLYSCARLRSQAAADDEAAGPDALPASSNSKDGAAIFSRLVELEVLAGREPVVDVVLQLRGRRS